MKEMLKLDMVNRAKEIYGYLSNLKEPQKCEESTLEFVIKEDDTINGKSWCSNGIDHVQINSGVIDLYYDYFAESMSEKTIDFLRKIRPSDSDEELKKISYEGIIYRNGKVETINSKIEDDEKVKLLEIFASRFIVLHEFGHVFNGHCNYLAAEMQFENRDGFYMYFDEHGSAINEKDSLNIRTLEMDADAFAATQSMSHLCFLYENFDKEVNIKIGKEDLFY